MRQLLMPPSLVAAMATLLLSLAVGLRAGSADVASDSIEARARQHWAFIPPQKSEISQLADDGEDDADVASNTDRFVTARLNRHNIAPSPIADARTQIRRLYYDLLGLPPTYEQIQSFAADPSDAAYEQLVDQLLASPHFGERWARHWLDVARFGDTKGYVFTADRNYPHAYKYRDWVIDALNNNMPYDQFLKYQIAADRFATGEDRRHLAAMGFLTLGRRFLNNNHDLIDDRIDVVFRGTMGLTASCARCHDHKYDPLSLQDYYGLYGVFASSKEQQDDDLPLRLVDRENPRDVRAFLRGSPRSRGEIAPRQFPTFFASTARPFNEGSGRKQLAEAIATRSNPLTARVLVNRAWGHLFGKGLVETPSDFGLRSDPPVHQDVLDYLAVSFMEDGWSVKRLIRRIVLSRVYRQRSDVRQRPQAIDPENLLLWRANRRRSDFEATRDSLLAVSGQLDKTLKGESVRIDTAFPSNRRTLYAFIDRQNLPGIFRTFDFASPDTHCPKRPNTTVPQQSLYMLNNPLVQDIAVEIAERIDNDDDVPAKVTQLFRTILARNPDERDIEMATRFLDAAAGIELEIEPPVWQYGYGRIHDGDVASVTFNPLPHFTGKAWQGVRELPDSDLGWATLNADGGHAGNDAEHAVIRRWVAPRDGIVSISGRLKHPSDQGDGVRGRVVCSTSGLKDEWTAKGQTVRTRVDGIKVARGDTIDFVTDCLSNVNHDSFEWSVTVRMRGSRDRWSSQREFGGPPPRPMQKWSQLAQALLWTNEFMFID